MCVCAAGSWGPCGVDMRWAACVCERERCVRCVCVCVCVCGERCL